MPNGMENNNGTNLIIPNAYVHITIENVKEVNADDVYYHLEE